MVRNAPMWRYTSIKVGGPVPCLFYPEDEEDVIAGMRWFGDRGMSYRFLGNGTNIIVSDAGMGMGLIRVTGMRRLRFTRTQGGALVKASAGLPLKTLIKECAARGLSGVEMLFGIPGTVGGAIKMNAGSFAVSVSDSLQSIRLADRNGVIRSLGKREMDFGYRSSSVGKGQCVLEAAFQLTDADPGRIRTDMERCWRQRWEKHPMEMASAGSIFKNRNGTPSWKYIEEAGLRGFRIGNACVSEKHANFIVNMGNATASDVKRLIDIVKMGVRDATGVVLEEEVELWGFDG